MPAQEEFSQSRTISNHRARAFETARAPPDPKRQDKLESDRRIEFSSCACSDTGRKHAANEDFYALEEKLGPFVVADGLGGHFAGRRAAEHGVGVFVERVGSDPEGGTPEILRDAFARAGEAIFKAAQVGVERRGMGDTLVAIWFRDGGAALAQACDSRLYPLPAGRLHALTLDHSVVGERAASGELNVWQARSDSSRHMITRAVTTTTPPSCGSRSTVSGARRAASAVAPARRTRGSVLFGSEPDTREHVSGNRIGSGVIGAKRDPTLQLFEALRAGVAARHFGQILDRVEVVEHGFVCSRGIRALPVCSFIALGHGLGLLQVSCLPIGAALDFFSRLRR